MFHVKHEGWAVGPVGHVDRLEAYEALLRSVAVPRGMVATADVDRLRERHIEDSLRVLPLIPREVETVLDLGSGAGLPGVPVAVARPDLHVTLSERRATRSAFLELVVERLELPNVSVFPHPAEQLSARFDLCLARGFAGADRTWAVASEVLGPEGRLAYWAGTTFDRARAPAGARFDAVHEPDLERSGPIVIMTRQ